MYETFEDLPSEVQEQLINELTERQLPIEESKAFFLVVANDPERFGIGTRPTKH